MRSSSPSIWAPGNSTRSPTSASAARTAYSAASPEQGRSAATPAASAVAVPRQIRLGTGREPCAAERSAMVESVPGKSEASVSWTLLELTEYAWHGCYGEVTPPDEVILDILTCSEGGLAPMLRAARLPGPSTMS